MVMCVNLINSQIQKKKEKKKKRKKTNKQTNKQTKQTGLLELLPPPWYGFPWKIHGKDC
jgi:hypothetical protein